MSEKQTLSWEKHPSAELVRLAWPIAVSTLSYSTMTLASTLFVSRVGTAALAGVGLGGVAALMLQCFTFGLLRGIKVLVSQSIGAGRPDEVREHVAAGLTLAVSLGLLTCAVAQVVAPLIGSLAATPEAAAYATAYLRIRLLASPIVLCFVVLRESRWGQGESREPMIASLTGNLVNVGLDVLLVVVLGLGVVGAAASTVIGQTVECGSLYRVIRRRGAVVWRGRWRRIVALWRIGVPVGVHFVLEFGAFALLTVMVARFSEAQAAAHQVVLQIIHLSFLPAMALGEAASVLAGQAVGARRDELVLEVARRALRIGCVYNGACGLVMAVAPHGIASLFGSDPAMRAAAVSLLYVAAIFQIADGANMVGRAVLRGTGDVRRTAMIGIVTSWMLTPPATLLLGRVMGLGVLGGWIGLCAEIIVGASLFWWRLQSGAWKPAAARARADADAVAEAEADEALAQASAVAA